LREIVEVNIPVDPARVGIFGHSMGGHGALICALKNPNIYKVRPRHYYYNDILRFSEHEANHEVIDVQTNPAHF
jgi:predicted alpha/beta superfamily hydrolase